MLLSRPLRSLVIGLGLLAVVLPACARSRTAAAPEASPPVPAPAPPAPRSGKVRIATEETLRELVPGKTTRAEVITRYGIPREVVLSPGIETFIYYRERTSGLFSRVTERYEMLTIRFDAQGLLKDYEYRLAGE